MQNISVFHVPFVLLAFLAAFSSFANGHTNCESDVQDALGTIYGLLVMGVSRNPSLREELVKIATFGHASVLAGRDEELIQEKYDALFAAANTTMLSFDTLDWDW